MTTVQKQHPITVRAVDGKSIRMLVSVFGNVDHAGDRVMPGAFKNSLARWRASGDPIPFLWAHNWADPMAHVGVVTRARETERGLEVEAEITDPTPFAEQVKRLLQQRRVKEASFSYDIVKERTADDGANELVELDLIECGPCLRGMNDQTELLSAKALVEMLAGERPELAHYNAQLDALVAKNRSANPALVDAFVTEVREELVREKLDADRIKRFDQELDERASVRGPVPQFDGRFRVESQPIEYESGPTETQQVAGVREESFRLAVDPGTMRPVEGASG